MMGARRHPFHCPVAAFAEPSHQIVAVRIMAVRKRKSASGEAKLAGLRAYCFLQLFASIHVAAIQALVRFFKEFRCFDRSGMIIGTA